MRIDIRERLKSSGARAAYNERPPYQRNDYLIWIDQATKSETRERRIRQMIDELKRGNVYMKMAWKATDTEQRRSSAGVVGGRETPAGRHARHRA
jgi:uncharacterized protein YdeI (YjbR/CyaY-like superfamily)